MRSRILALVATAFLCTGGGVALTSCGDDGGSVDLAKTVRATADKGTARTTMKVRVSGLGLPGPLAFTAKGVTALAEPRGRLTLDLGPLLTLVGAPAGGDRGLELIVNGADVYAKPPKLDGLTIPEGRSWITLDLAALAKAAGLRTEGLGDLVTLDPSSQLRALRASKGMDEVGKEKVAGVETTHFKGTYRLSDLVEGLPPAERARARAAIKDLERVGGKDSGIDEPTPADLWVDGQGVTRRMRSTAKLPGQGGAPGGHLVFDYALSDFGATLDTTPPPASERYDVTDDLDDALRGQARRRTR